MKTKCLKLLAMLLVVATCMGFASCSDDDEENSSSSNNLKGWWFTDPWEGWNGYKFIEAFNFLNNSEVVYYSYVANGTYWDDWSASFPGKSGWYYQNGCEGRYSYKIVDKILYLYSANDAKTFDFFDGCPYGFHR